MVPFTTNGDYWRVARVPAGDPRLVDRTGSEKLATTDPSTMTIYVSETVRPPLLDKVVMHEVSHAVAYSNGLISRLRAFLPVSYQVNVEEWAASIVENHALEVSDIASKILGRRVCVRGFCYD